MNWIQLFLFPIILILVHEAGHFLAAKREGIYKGWGIFPNPKIKLTRPHGSRWGYLSGFAASLFLYPLWVLLLGWESPHWFLAFCLAGACFNIPIILFYGRIMKRREKKLRKEAV